MSDDLTTTRIRDSLDFQDVKIAALNRGFNMLLNVLVHNKVLNENQELWVDKIKRDQKLAKVIDGEQLMEKLLAICYKLPCPEDVNTAADLVRKVILPKL